MPDLRYITGPLVGPFFIFQRFASRACENKVKYKYLYEVFDKYHEMPLETIDWHDGMIKEATGDYKA